MEDSAALWEFALALYSSPGVEKTLLRLQDHAHANVNVLLWACWLQKRNIRLNHATIEQAETSIAEWDRDVVQSLRKLRRQLKAKEAESAVIATVREQIKSAELSAERHCLHLLAEVPVGAPAAEEPDNIRLYLEHLACEEEVAPLRAAMACAEK